MAAIPVRPDTPGGKDPAPDPGPPQAWDPTTVHKPETVNTPDGGKTPDPPPVPKGGEGGSGKEAVNTASMDQFAKNVAQLVPYVIEARNRMASGSAAVVHPGGFYDAYQLRSTTSGPNGGGGLQQKYYNVLADLAEGLQDISDGMRSVSKKYTTASQLAKMKTSDLQEALSDALADFQRLGTDSGATVTSTGGPSNSTGSGNGSGSGNSTTT
ncbi:hypothetical protein [Streptomyces cinerochromogenes]|uniref:hypothetical protein n=1 Tax=Streptomyces cinerochromogenes TaxID=66422 RepID=UPI0033A3CA0B